MFVKFLKITIALCSFFILMNAMPLYAAGLNFKPQIGIGGDFTKGANVAVSSSTQTIGEYIKQIYKYAIGVVGIVAVVVMMIGGVLWMTAGGNPSQVGSAQQYITGALTGLVLVMFSYVILKTVNPDLVSFRVSTIKEIEVADPLAELKESCCMNDMECGQGAVCYKGVPTPQCKEGEGICQAVKLKNENETCDPTNDHLIQCQPPFTCLGSGNIGHCLRGPEATCGENDTGECTAGSITNWCGSLTHVSGGASCGTGFYCCR